MTEYKSECVHCGKQAVIPLQGCDKEAKLFYCQYCTECRDLFKIDKGFYDLLCDDSIVKTQLIVPDVFNDDSKLHIKDNVMSMEPKDGVDQ